MTPNEDTVPRLYDARARGDLDAVGELLAEDVVWHEPGDQDYSGDYHGRDAVIGLLRKLVEVTDETFYLRPVEFLATERHAVALVEWEAARGGKRIEGKEIAVYRIEDANVAEVWFHPDGVTDEDLAAVFGYEEDS